MDNEEAVSLHKAINFFADNESELGKYLNTLSVQWQDGDGRNALHVALARQPFSPSIFQIIFKVVADNNMQAVLRQQDGAGWTALHLAASRGLVEPLKDILWLAKNTNSVNDLINVRNGSGRTALHYAASRGNLECLRLLLNYGTIADLTDNLGQTALHRAASSGHASSVELLVEKCPLLISMIDHEKQTAEQLAEDDAKICQILRQAQPSSS